MGLIIPHILKWSLCGTYFNNNAWNTSRLPVCKKSVKYFGSDKNRFSVMISLRAKKDDESGDNHFLSISLCWQRLNIIFSGNSCILQMWKRILSHFSLNFSKLPLLDSQHNQKWLSIDLIHGLRSLFAVSFAADVILPLILVAECHISCFWGTDWLTTCVF